MPRQHADKPNLFLAAAVESYHLTYKKNILRYAVKLKRNFYAPTESGEAILDFQTWQAETMRHYSKTWTLIEAFANLLGKDFAVVEDVDIDSSQNHSSR
jgi:hypothetical protein